MKGELRLRPPSRFVDLSDSETDIEPIEDILRFLGIKTANSNQGREIWDSNQNLAFAM